MSLQPILLLLGVLMISSTQGARNLRIIPQRPPAELSDKNPLSVKCVFNSVGSNIHSLTSLKLYRKKLGQTTYKLAASKVYSEVKSSLGPGPTVTAEFNGGGESFLSVKYSTPTDGYCYTYRCVAEGKNYIGQLRQEFTTFGISSPRGLTCTQVFAITTTKAPLLSDCSSGQSVKDLEEEVNNNELKIEKLLIILIKASTLGSKYFISDFYNGRVYFMSKTNEGFNLNTKNKQCIDAGGYLVELDDTDEQEFVAQFSKAAGRSSVFVSANDVDKEGSFVQYNSKKPIPQLKWKKGEPNNYANSEDCTAINADGLNDLVCTTTGRYVCEVPLV
ncbi:collectin-11 [Plakobranchus ocellatus]|uniref:Collectin-11 n=1 Tax=Plakobranchus ocellatus TaxID=259542 RepID=A0AAV3ZY82_9GAST|nr:collectin-11 [Plakobranchus ocellatus]